MTDAPDLDAIEERVSMATPGPWVVDHHANHHPEDPEWSIESHAHEFDDPPAIVDGVTQGADDAEFIAQARTDVPTLVAALREAEGYEEELSGRLNMIIEACWRTGIQYDRELDDDKNDYPMRVIREQAAALREAEAKLAAIRDVAEKAAATGWRDTLTYTCDEAQGIQSVGDDICAILDGKGEPT